MDVILDAVEVRVLSVLVEKEITTPEYYPLTLNALTNACNQKSNRDPVVTYDETTVVRALDSLSERQLIYMTKGDSRVPKYHHRFTYQYNLMAEETAVLCELMLRGPQTVGELRGHAERMYAFNDLGEVEASLQKLMTKEERLVTKLPRQAGRKESRYAHLLSGEPVVEAEEPVLRPEPARVQVRAETERVAKLEQEIQSIRQEVDELKHQFNEFRKQFE